jgi:hypothetical protein
VVREAALLITLGLLGVACSSGDATCHGGGAEAAGMVEQGWTGSDPVPAVTVGAWVEGYSTENRGGCSRFAPTRPSATMTSS